MRLAKIAFLLLLTFLVACGDATRNSNGTTFTFFGWFTDTTGDIGQSVLVTTLDNIGGDGPNASIAGNVLFAGLQNNLAGQFIIVDRVNHSYVVPGANVNIPSTSVGISSLVRPAALGGGAAGGAGGGAGGGDGGAGGGAAEGGATFGNPLSTLPQNAFTDAGASFAGTLIIPASVASFITLNRDLFPQPPFSIIVNSSVEGTTSAGDRVETNDIQFEIVVENDVFINPNAGDAAAATAVNAAADGQVDGGDSTSTSTATGTPGTGSDSDVTFF